MLDEADGIRQRPNGVTDDGGDVVVRRRDAVVELCGDPQPGQVDVGRVAERRGHCVRIAQIGAVHDRQAEEQIFCGPREWAVTVERSEDAKCITEDTAGPRNSAVSGLQPCDSRVVGRLSDAAAAVGPDAECGAAGGHQGRASRRCCRPVCATDRTDCWCVRRGMLFDSPPRPISETFVRPSTMAPSARSLDTAVASLSAVARSTGLPPEHSNPATCMTSLTTTGSPCARPSGAPRATW